jgi:hypothetical protein
MGNQHLILPIIFHAAFDNCLPHKHLTTFLHATMNLVKKSKYQKLRFAILKVTICTVESWVRLKCGSGYGTERMRNGTDMGLKRGTERTWG